MTKLHWIILLLAASMLLSLAFACGDDDDDDDDDTDGDDDDSVNNLTEEDCAVICGVLIDCMSANVTQDECVVECTEGVQDDCSDCFINCANSYDDCDDIVECIEVCPCEDVPY